jgi:hypothetical protein
LFGIAARSPVGADAASLFSEFAAMTSAQILMLVTPFVLLAVGALGAWLAVKKDI